MSTSYRELQLSFQPLSNDSAWFDQDQRPCGCSKQALLYSKTGELILFCSDTTKNRRDGIEQSLDMFVCCSISLTKNIDGTIYEWCEDTKDDAKDDAKDEEDKLPMHLVLDSYDFKMLKKIPDALKVLEKFEWTKVTTYSHIAEYIKFNTKELNIVK